MSGIRHSKPANRVFGAVDGPPATLSLAPDIRKDDSKSFGASVGLFENCAMEWTVLYDEYMYILEGEVNLETREGTYKLEPGDGIWLPNGTWVIYHAEYAKAVVIIHPINWAELQDA